MSSVASAFESLEERFQEVERRDVEGVSHLMQASLNATMERGIKTMCLEFGVSVLMAVATEYEMDAKEMAERIGLEGIEVKRVTARKSTAKKGTSKTSAGSKWDKPSVLLPWTGERYANPDVCLGIRSNFKLYSQCTNKRLGDGKYCKTCQGQATKNETAGKPCKPTAGDVEDREKQGVCSHYELPSGKTEAVQHYGNVVEKASKDEKKSHLYQRATILAEAEKFGLTITDEMLEPKAKKRPGRPKKSDTEEEDSEDDVSIVSKAVKAVKKAKETETEKADEFDSEAHGYDEDMIELASELEEADKAVEKAKSSKAETSDDDDDSDASSKSKKAKKTSKSSKATKSKKFSFGGYECKKHKNGSVTAKVDGSDMELADFLFEDGAVISKKTMKKVSATEFKKTINKNKMNDDSDSSDDDSDDE